MSTGRAASNRKPGADVTFLVILALLFGAPILLLCVALAAGGLAGLLPARARRDQVLRGVVALVPLAVVAAVQFRMGWTTTIITADLLAASVALGALQMTARVRDERDSLHRAA